MNSKLLFLYGFCLLFFASSANAGTLYQSKDFRFQIEFPNEYAESISTVDGDQLVTVGSSEQDRTYLMKYGLHKSELPAKYRAKFLEEVKKNQTVLGTATNATASNDATSETLQFIVESMDKSDTSKRHVKIIVAKDFWIVLNVTEPKPSDTAPASISQFMNSFKITDPS